MNLGNPKYALNGSSSRELWEFDLSPFTHEAPMVAVIRHFPRSYEIVWVLLRKIMQLWADRLTETSPWDWCWILAVTFTTIGRFLLCQTKRKLKHSGNTWVFPKIGIPQNGWFIMEKAYFLMDDNGGKTPLCSETPTWWSWICSASRAKEPVVYIRKPGGRIFPSDHRVFPEVVQLWKPVKFESCNLDQFDIYKSHNPSKTCENPLKNQCQQQHANKKQPGRWF